jgi:hypothetical protein
VGEAIMVASPYWLGDDKSNVAEFAKVVRDK